jgi:hypothetical protein
MRYDPAVTYSNGNIRICLVQRLRIEVDNSWGLWCAIQEGVSIVPEDEALRHGVLPKVADSRVVPRLCLVTPDSSHWRRLVLEQTPHLDIKKSVLSRVENRGVHILPYILDIGRSVE